jgi:hypothetical protein
MIKAIETDYKGYRFRSRLEARWAVFFDALGLRWEYEPEGFELPSGRYLPDFFVRMPATHGATKRHPGAGYWVEVKGEDPTQRELTLLQQLSVGTKHHAHLVVGPPDTTAPVWHCRNDGEAARVSSLTLPWLAFIAECSPVRPSVFWSSYEEALAAARGARFEFGESGALRV